MAAPLVVRNPLAATMAIPKEEKEKDPYVKFKSLERRLEFLAIQEEYIKDEVKNLKREILRAQEEVGNPLTHYILIVIGQENSVGPIGDWTIFGDD